MFLVISLKVLVFEDAPNGVAAAKAAGLYCVMVPHPQIDLKCCEDADQVLSSLEQLELKDWNLPAMTGK